MMSEGARSRHAPQCWSGVWLSLMYIHNTSNNNSNNISKKADTYVRRQTALDHVVGVSTSQPAPRSFFSWRRARHADVLGWCVRAGGRVGERARVHACTRATDYMVVIWRVRVPLDLDVDVTAIVRVCTTPSSRPIASTCASACGEK